MKHGSALAAGIVAAIAMLLPAAAQAHVSIHPNTVPEGAFATLTVRVPGEEENAYADKVAMQLPPGFISVDTENVPGWKVAVKTKKLPKPVETDDGPIDEEVSELVWTGDGTAEGRLEDGSFVQFPLSVAIPEGMNGKSLAFKTLEYYSNGKVARWIGPPSAEEPAPTINVTEKGGVIEDVAGGEAGPTPGEAPSGEGTETAMSGEGSSSGGSDDTLAIIALIVGALGLLVGGGALAMARRGGSA